MIVVVGVMSLSGCKIPTYIIYLQDRLCYQIGLLVGLFWALELLLLFLSSKFLTCMEGRIFSLDLPEFVKLEGSLFIEGKILLWENVTERNRSNRIPLSPEHLQVQSKTDISVLCTCGEMVVKIAFRTYVIKPGTLCIILAGNIFESVYTSDDFRGYVTVFDRSFSLPMEYGTQDIMNVFYTLRNKFSFSLTDSEVRGLSELYNGIGRILDDKERAYRLNMLRACMSILYFFIIPIVNREQNETVISRLSRQEEIFIKFLREVEIHYKRERSIKFYADKLCLTPKYLSSVVFSASRRLAGEWINDYVMLEAKALLRTKDLSIQQISDMLNFSNQSFFGKFFKRHAGVSPKSYRKRAFESNNGQ